MKAVDSTPQAAVLSQHLSQHFSQQQRMETVWRERAIRLSQRPVPADAAQNAARVIVLGIGKERYGVDLADVAEVLPPVRATPVPGAAKVFAGVINVHGEIRPVIDLKELLGIGRGGETDIEAGLNGGLARVILLRREGREIGLQIDSVEQIRRLDSTEIDSGDPAAGSGNTESAGRVSSKYTRGSTKDLLTLLNTAALFAEIQTGVTT